MKLFNALAEVAYHSDSELFQMIACCMVKLTLRHGTTEFSTIAYAALGIVLGPVFHLFRDGEDFARLAVAVSERHGYMAPRAGAHFLMQMAVVWTRPIEDALTCLEAAARSARETGEMVYACYSRQHRVTDLMARGDPSRRNLARIGGSSGFRSETPCSCLYWFVLHYTFAYCFLVGGVRQPAVWAGRLRSPFSLTVPAFRASCSASMRRRRRIFAIGSSGARGLRVANARAWWTRNPPSSVGQAVRSPHRGWHSLGQAGFRPVAEVPTGSAEADLPEHERSQNGPTFS